MSEKTPRIKPHAITMVELARKGMEMYRYPQLPTLSQEQQRRLGQLSFFDTKPQITASLNQESD